MATDEPITFGQLLRRFRRSTGLTQEVLAERAGISVRTISDLERGLYQRPHWDTVQLLADALSLTAEDRTTLEVAGGRGLGSRPPASIQVRAQPSLQVAGFLGSLPAGPLIARRTELEQLLVTIDEVRAGNGRLVVLAGEPGVGKTRLAQELAVATRDMGLTVVTGSCYESRQAIPYYPFLDVLSAIYAAAPDSIRTAVPHRWPYLRRLLPDAGIPAAPPLSAAQEDQEWVFRAIAGFIQATTEVVPVALLLDDLHWADTASLDLLHYLARSSRGSRLLLLGTYRTLDVGQAGTPWTPLQRLLADLEREGLSEALSVGRLDREGTSNLLLLRLGEGTVADAFSNLVYRHTEGNPFFVQQVLRVLIERGEVTEVEQVWKVRDAAEVGVPESIRGIVQERVARLSVTAQGVLHEASVLGQTFPFDDVLAIGDEGEREVEAALTEAGTAGLVREVGRDLYAFNHALTQQVLYTDLSSRRRRWLHEAAGEALERLPEGVREGRAAELAWHFLEGDDQERALRWTIVAGDQAEAVFAHAEAEQHYRRGLQLAREAGDRDREAEVLAKLGAVFSRVGRFEEALSVLDQALAIHRSHDDLEAQGWVVAQIAETHLRCGAAVEGMARIHEMLEPLEEIGPSPSLASLYAAFHWLLFIAGRYADSLPPAERAAELARALGDQRLLAEAEVARGAALTTMGRMGQAVRVLEDAIPLVEATGDLAAMQWALHWLGCCYLGAGQFGAAVATSDRARQFAVRIGDPLTTALSTASVACYLAFMGDLRRARTHLQAALDAFPPGSDSPIYAYLPLALGSLLLWEGAWEEATSHLQHAVGIAEVSGDITAQHECHGWLAEIEIGEGRSAAAIARLEPLVGDDCWTLPFVLVPLAWAHLEQGNEVRAEQLLERVIAFATSDGCCYYLPHAFRVKGMLLSRRKKWEQAAKVFDQALALAREMPWPYEEGRVLYEYARMHLASGDLEQALQSLRQALAIFQQLGARPYVERTSQALARVESRPLIP